MSARFDGYATSVRENLRRAGRDEIQSLPDIELSPRFVVALCAGDDQRARRRWYEALTSSSTSSIGKSGVPRRRMEAEPADHRMAHQLSVALAFQRLTNVVGDHLSDAPTGVPGEHWGSGGLRRYDPVLEAKRRDGVDAEWRPISSDHGADDDTAGDVARECGKVEHVITQLRAPLDERAPVLN
jgi:hypothetical protein